MVFFDFKLWLGLCISVLFSFVFIFYRQVFNAIVSKFFILFTAAKNSTTVSFILSETGEWQFNNQKGLQISAHSQINLWGYWLVFTKNETGLSKQFIFKDSLSSEDQARLARTIMRVQQLQH